MKKYTFFIVVLFYLLMLCVQSLLTRKLHILLYLYNGETLK